VLVTLIRVFLEKLRKQNYTYKGEGKEEVL